MNESGHTLNDQIKIAAQHIREGHVVAFPTETVYGLGANALNPDAVARIFEVKERPSFDPLIVHIAEFDQLNDLTTSKDERIKSLADRFWPGPLTIVLPKKAIVPDLVTSGLPTVGIRMPNHPIAIQLIKTAGCPIAAPSANKFGRVSPTQLRHVADKLPGVDYVLDGGPSQIGLESTIIRIHEDGFEILRPGAITAADLMEVLPQSSKKLDAKNLVSPGLLASHYSPSIPLYLSNNPMVNELDWTQGGYIGVRSASPYPYREQLVLSPDGDLSTYAIHMFESIHTMEDAGVDFIVVEPVQEVGIGIAIMDRLRKAAFQYKS